MSFIDHDWEHDVDFLFLMNVLVFMLVSVAIVIGTIVLFDYIPDWQQPVSPYVFPPTMD